MKKSIPHSTESAIEMFLQGEEAIRKKHQQREQEKISILRIGSSGCMIGPDTCIGACPQTTLARFIGHQLPTEASQPYFDGGISNEFTWETNITAAGIDYKCEEDIPVVHTLPCGTKLTGRPDMATGTQVGEEFKPELMIELKACQATNSAANKLLLEKPDLKHLIQAAAYGMFMGIPATLVYTVNISGGISNYFTKREAGQNEVSFGKVQYPIGWDDGTLYYMKGKHRIDTIVTQQGILDYFSNIAKMAKEKKPNLIYQDMVDIEGDMMPYNPRNYSDINNLVSDDLPYDEWAEKLKLVCAQEYQIKLKKKK